MAVSDNYVPTKTLGNGVTVEFTANWNVIAASYIRVYLENVSTGVQVLQTKDTDYTLTFDESGLTVDFTIGTTPPSTEYVVIARSITQDQTVPYKTSQGFQGAVTENSFDKMISISQDQQDELDRSLKFPIASGKVGILPTPLDGYGIIWDGTAGTMRNTTSSLADLEGDAETVADNIASVNTVATSIASVNTVSAAISNVNTVAGSITNVNTVAGSITNVNTVAGSIANVNTVSGSIASVNTVASNISDVIDAANNIPKANRSATAAPVVGDDDADGYSAGSLWVDITNDRTYICLDASTGAAVWNDFTDDVVNVKSFGAKGDGVTDDTAAIQAAEDFASTALPSGSYRALYFPPGDYFCAELVWSTKTLWFGDEVARCVRLVYNGAGGSGSYMVAIATDSGAIPAAGFKNIQFRGYDTGNASGGIVERMWKNNGIDFDWGFKVENVQFNMCTGDAIDLTGATEYFVNLFMNRVRFDGIGGFAIKLNGLSTNSGNPFVLTQFTLDNNISGAFATRAQALGDYDGTHWGKGLIHMEDGRSVFSEISFARIELNKPLITHDGGFSLIYSDNTLSGSQARFVLRGICGTGRTNQPINMVRDTTGRTTATFYEVGMSDVATKFLDDTDTLRTMVGRSPSPVEYSLGNSQQASGINLNNFKFEARPSAPSDGNIFERYRQGDLVVYNGAQADTRGLPILYRCKSPRYGSAIGTTGNVTTSAVVTSGSADIGVSGSIFATMHVGLNITLVGAGAAAADLDTYITAVDPVADTITVADTPSTSVNPATIAYYQAQFSPVLYEMGISDDIGNSNTTANLGASPEIVLYNTPLTADRTVTLSVASNSRLGTGGSNGGHFRVVRTAAATGAFNLSVGGLKNLAAGEWADVHYNGSSFLLTAFGSL